MKKTKRICTLLLAIVLTASMSLQPDIGRAFADNVEQTGQMTESAEKSAGGAENAGESSEKVFYKQLMACSSLTDFEALLCDEENSAALDALTEEELNQLLAHVDEIWAATTEPTEAETLLKEKALKKLSEYTDEPIQKDSEPAKKGSPAKPKKKKAATMKAAEDTNYIYFDLAAGNVEIGKDSYSGKVYVAGEPKDVSANLRTDNEKFYIYQSNITDSNSAGYYTKTGYKTNEDYENKANCRVPNYSRVTYNGEEWWKYITNNTKVKTVSENWDLAAKKNSKREATNHYITFASESNYIADVTIDNIWSNYYQKSTWRTTGGIGAYLKGKEGGTSEGKAIDCNDTHILLRLKGDNRVGCVHYSAGEDKNNTIEFNDGETTGTPGSITVADFSADGWNGNHWNAAIGGADNPAGMADQSDGIVINGGVIYAGTTIEDNCTAIGGGGNDYGGVTINKGTVTAVASSTGTAIGGGIGYSDPGGDTDVTINDGEIYAYNLGINTDTDISIGGFAKFVPAAAIGGGGSNESAGGLTANITITGGTIYAQSMGGPGIGGGGSANSTGGPATINITGGTIIAKSTDGTYGTDEIDPGVSIGGGTGETGGGSVTLNIGENDGEEPVIRAGSIGGGKCTGSGPLGSANVAISGGDITGQVIMQGTGDENKKCTFDMSKGTIHNTNVIEGFDVEPGIVKQFEDFNEIHINYLEKNGGAVWMNDTIGVTDISGGTIEGCTANLGGAVYMQGGKFTLSGKGKIDSNTAKRTEATDTTAAVGGMGGGVYINGGDVDVTGGSVSSNKAQIRGGGLYVTGGNVSVTGGSISSNIAGFAPNGVSLPADVGRGGGVYLEGEGLFNMSGGSINDNTANYRGGGIFLTKKPTLTAGTISGNKAKDSGGGICVNGDAVELSNADMKIFGNNAKNGGGVAVLNGGFTLNGGAVGVKDAAENKEEKPNTATNGGGVYVAKDVATSTGSNSTANVTVTSGNIWYNKAANGGGVYLASGDFTMQENDEATASISHNVATENGGGIYLYTNPHLLKGTIANNTATGNGGGMYIEDCLVTLEPTGAMTITGNGANNGAGIYIHGNQHDTQESTPEPEPTTQVDAVTSVTQLPQDAVGLLIDGDTTGNLILTNNIATQSGGAVCIEAADKQSRFELDTDNVTVTGNQAKNGGGVAVLNGNFTMTKGSIGKVDGANEATKGGGVYVSSGQVWLRGGSVNYNTANDGGGAYVAGGDFYMIDGFLANNQANTNGGGAYVAGDFHMLNGTIGGEAEANANKATNGGGVYVSDGNVTVLDGTISHNKATNDGGGFYVSALDKDAVKVVMLSGSLSNNEATENGGGMAVESTDNPINVEIGCLRNHNIVGNVPTYPVKYEGEYETYKNYKNIVTGLKHESCPVVENNKAGKIGGGFYMNSDASRLSFYCVKETNNTAGGSNTAGMDVVGGTVIIGDETYHNHEHDSKKGQDAQKSPWGYVSMDDATLVNGGQVDIYGDMTNPIFKNEVTVDIKNKETDHFMDHRRAYNVNDGYKVHYIENFKGTGLYQEYQYDDTNCVITIPAALYSHPGYKILGWYTKDTYNQANPEKNHTFYEVGKEYNLSNKNDVPQMGIHPIDCEYCGEAQPDSNLLKLYAIWEANGYTVVFDPNVPDGDIYTGVMEDQMHAYGETLALSPNQYKYPGHIFQGWNTKADGTGISYTDEEEVSNLTKENGVEIVLYAQWEKCDHSKPDWWTYDVVDEGKTLRRICSCGGQTLTATLNAEDTVYDGHSHPATLTFNDEVAWGKDKPTIEYKGERLTQEDTTKYKEIKFDNGKPFHAGNYTASITKPDGDAENKVTASVKYTIAKAEQEAPEKPTYEISDNKLGVNINRINNDPHTWIDETNKTYSAEAQYCLTYKDNPNEEWDKMPKGSNVLTKTLTTALTNYIVQVRYEELEDYNASDITEADATYFYEGDVKVIVNCDKGISYQIVYAAKDNGTTTNGVKLNLDLKEGYYLVGEKFTVTAKLQKDSETTSKEHEVKEMDKKKYSITNIPDKSTLTITIGTTKKATTIEGKVMPGQKFSTFTGATKTEISRDSAFTAAFEISNFDPDTYDVPSLTFESAIPKDTTIILLERKGGEKTYWYYRVEGNDSIGSVQLTSFKKMGGNGSEQYSIAESSGYINLSYQFIVDFSQSAAGYPKNAEGSSDNLNMQLQVPLNDKNATTPQAVKENVEVSMKDSTFGLEKTEDENNSLTNSFSCTFTKGATASKWENRASALILTPDADTKLPADARIKAQIGDRLTYLYKSNGSFIVPMSLLKEKQEVKLTLESNLFPAEGKSYTFTAKWLISPSKTGKAPLNYGSAIEPSQMIGDQAGNVVEVTFTSVKSKTPSLKTTGDYRIVDKGDTLKLDIEKLNMDGYTISADVLEKVNESYTTFGVHIPPLTNEGTLSVSCTYGPGSYCVMLTVKKTGSATIIMEVPYYFIVKEKKAE